MRFTAAHAELANGFRARTMVEHLDIRFHADEEGHFCATMPVDSRTHQPAGLLHGGATAALAESLGSMGSHLMVMEEGKTVVGVEINANHMKGVKAGTVTATGELIHSGRSSHVWDIRVRDDQGRLVAACRLTALIIEAR